MVGPEDQNGAPGAAESATEAKPDEFGLSELVTFYIQQNGAVNQLWAMYAVTAFTASIFAVSAGLGLPGNWVRLAGLAGFLVFTVGHYSMVVSGATRLNLAAADIARLRGDRPADAHPAVVGHIALGYSVRATRIVHILIDSCVVAAFAAMAFAGMVGGKGPVH